MEFKNETDLIFSDISSEEWRVYYFPNGESVKIERPLKLNVSKSGGHRLFSENDISNYIPSGWICLAWKPKDGYPNFVK